MKPYLTQMKFFCPQVKNMISTRRDSVRKKSSSSHRKSTVERPGHDSHVRMAVEVSAASDPEVISLTNPCVDLCYHLKVVNT